MAYKIKNRYCHGTKIDEETFVTLLKAWLSWMSAAGAATRTGLSPNTTERMYKLIRNRLLEDEILTGWMGGGAYRLPPAQDEVWQALYDCIYQCPAVHIVKELKSAVLNEASSGSQISERRRQKITVAYTRQIVTCTSCYLQDSYRLNFLIRIQFAKHRAKLGGIPRSNFKPHFFEVMYRINHQKRRHSGEVSAEFDDHVNEMLRRFEEEPLGLRKSL